MRTALAILDDIQIASPCSARWEDMVGDQRTRHCHDCDRSVYDLSGLTAEQAVALIREKEGNLCVRLFRRADGRTLTADCPVGLRARLAQVGRVGASVWAVACGVAALWFAFIVGAWRHADGRRGQPPAAPRPSAPVVADEPGEQCLGKIAVPEEDRRTGGPPALPPVAP